MRILALVVLLVIGCGVDGTMGPRGSQGPPGRDGTVVSYAHSDVFDKDGLYALNLPSHFGVNPYAVRHELVVENDGTVFMGVVHSFIVSSDAYYSIGIGIDDEAQRIRVLLAGFPGQGFTYIATPVTLKQLEAE